MNLSPNQIAQLAYNAGFRGSALRMATSVALAESNGNPNAYNPEVAAGTRPGHGSRGLWQIYGTAHPEYDNAQLFNPQLNANAAYQVYTQAGNRFTPWSTYNNGSAYQISQNLNLNLPTGQVVLESGQTSGTASLPVTGLPEPQSATRSGLTGTMPQVQTQSPLVSVSLLPENVKQGIEHLDPKFIKQSLALGLVGFLLVGLGAGILFAQLIRPVAGTVIQTTGKVAEAGRAVGAL